jgi:putative glutamine amidotransferase
MRRAPLIGVTMSYTAGAETPRAHLNAAYVRAVQDAGGVPIPLPPSLDDRAREILAGHLDALLLTGGGDVDPARYGEAAHPSVMEVSGERDALEIALVRDAIARARPILAICRGIQVLNVALGGSLHQDIPADLDTTIKHLQKEPRHEPTHAVAVAGGCRLAMLLGARDVQVNSLHHQAVKRVAPGLRPVAWAPDGVIEGLESPDPAAFVVGVQWHPEELATADPGARRLFVALVEAARQA